MRPRGRQCWTRPSRMRPWGRQSWTRANLCTKTHCHIVSLFHTKICPIVPWNLVDSKVWGKLLYIRIGKCFCTKNCPKLLSNALNFSCSKKVWGKFLYKNTKLYSNVTTYKKLPLLLWFYPTSLQQLTLRGKYMYKNTRYLTSVCESADFLPFSSYWLSSYLLARYYSC